MIKIVLLAVATSSMLVAGGFKIPELSLNAVALSSANVAHASGADTAYYNPANMVFMKDEHIIENDLTYIGLSDSNYEGTYTSTITGTSGPYDIKAKRENFFVPTLHYVSGSFDDVRFGLSIVTPYGLSKRWSDAPAVYSAHEFSLQTTEVNPSIAVPIGNKFAIAAGVRVVHTSGVVKSTSPLARRDMDGDSIDFGYNLALAYKPTSNLELGLTYRSKMDLTVEGDATLFFKDALNTFGGGAGAEYNSQSTASVDVHLPDVLNLAIAYTFASETTVEFVYERTFWSEYSELDFNYGSGVNAVTNAVFGAVLEKNWKDVSSYRLGVTQKFDKITLMGGVVYDETPIPNETLGFDLPDSDLLAFSLGVRYQMSEKVNLGLSTLYAPRKSRVVNNDELNGKFTDTSALLVSAGFEYKF